MPPKLNYHALYMVYSMMSANADMYKLRERKEPMFEPQIVDAEKIKQQIIRERMQKKCRRRKP